MPIDDAKSELSVPGRLLVNAVPGIDDAAASAHYLGDTPMDWADFAEDKLRALLGDGWRPSEVEARLLVFEHGDRDAVGAAVAGEARDVIGRFWARIDEACREEWGRGPTAAERRWCGELLVRRLVGR